MKWTERATKLLHKAQRLRYPKRFRHMASCPRGLDFGPVDPGSDARDILWKKRVVGRLGCRHALRASARGPCFVVGTGPSLQNENLAALAGIPTFGVNGAILKFLTDGVPPTYYTITDPDFFRNRFEIVRRVIDSGAACFFSGEGIGHICERDPNVLRHGRIYLSEVVNRRWRVPRLTPSAFDEAASRDPDFELHPTVPPQNGLVGFSRDLRQGLFCGRTIGYRAIQISYFLGFRRVFLLGMDMSSEGRKVRFYETLAEGRPSLLEKDFEPYILPCFEIVRRLRVAGELEVYNCSPTSRLPPEVTPRLSFEEARAMCIAMKNVA